MLRVRPVVGTPHAGAWAELLLALGLAELRHDISGERCLAADSGRVLIRTAPAFAVTLGFEVRDLDKFAQWTRSDGTQVLLQATETGRIGHITADDRLEFTVTPVDAGITAGSGLQALPGSPGVLAVWNTPDVQGSAQTLRNIGAKQSPGGQGSPGARFRAKNGGFVDLRAAEATGVELEIGILGGTGPLAARLEAAGFQPRFTAGSRGRTLLVPHPDGGDLRVAERHHDGPGPGPRE